MSESAPPGATEANHGQAARLAARLPDGRETLEKAGSPPAMALRPGERALWIGRLTSRPLSRGAIALLVGSGAAALASLVWSGSGFWLTAAALGTAGLLTAALSSITVSADAEGLKVRYGWFAWPNTKIDTSRIKSARVIDVKPMEWGGWGYRGSLKLMNSAAVVLRAGSGIRLDLANDKVFVVTVDDPESGAALLNAAVSNQV